jgi:lysophospholipase L1-like esterase
MPMTKARSVANYSSAYQLGSSQAGAPGGTSSIHVILTADAANLRLTYGNFYGDLRGTAAEIVPRSTLRIGAAIHFEGGPVLRCTFGGSAEATLPPGALVTSDALPDRFRRGTQLGVRTFVQPEPRGEYPLATVARGRCGEGFAPGVDCTRAEVAPSPWPGVDAPVYGPLLLTAETSNPRDLAVAGIGDSIMEGLGDLRGRSSFFTRALGETYGHVFLPKASACTDEFVGERFRLRLPLLAAADWAINALGINDVANGVEPSAIMANALRIGATCRENGVGAILATLLPFVRDVGDFQTACAQLPAQFEPTRVAYNAWVRDGAPVRCTGAGGLTPAFIAHRDPEIRRAGHPAHPYAFVIDLNATLEVNTANQLELDGGRWTCAVCSIPAGGAGYRVPLTYDGTHPTHLGHRVIACRLASLLNAATSTPTGESHANPILAAPTHESARQGRLF